MATPEENLQNALSRVQAAMDKGDTRGVERWQASADRYTRLIELKQRIAKSRENVEAIRERIAKIKESDTVVATPVVSTPFFQPSGTVSESTASPTFFPVVSAVPPIPIVSQPVVATPPPPPVKTAPLDTILYNEEAQPIEIMADLIFENIGGQEIINIARTDTVNGQEVVYQPIKNLTQIQQQYNPNNILSIQLTSNKYFQNFPIKLDNKVPEEGNGPNGAHVYIDPENGDLVIETINTESDEQVEIEIRSSGTIYEAEI